MSCREQVLRAQQGDKEAFVEVMRSIESGLYGTARAMIKKEEDIADAMQETIMKAYKSLDTLREPDFFKTWVYRILINECNTILKKRQQSISLDILPDHTFASDQVSSVELRMAVDQLEEQQRIVVVLYYFEGFPLKEVASMLKITESAVKTRLYRARKILMQELHYSGEGTTHYESL